jgi:hypothetical protein
MLKSLTRHFLIRWDSIRILRIILSIPNHICRCTIFPPLLKLVSLHGLWWDMSLSPVERHWAESGWHRMSWEQRSRTTAVSVGTVAGHLVVAIIKLVWFWLSLRLGFGLDHLHLGAFIPRVRTTSRLG